MNTSSPFVALPERFNCLESMLFAPQPTEATRAAEHYVGHLLSRPVPPPRLVTLAALPETGVALVRERGSIA